MHAGRLPGSRRDHAAAAVCPSADQVWREYLTAVRGVPSSGDQRRALMALLDRPDLTAATVDEVRRLAEHSIASSGDRDTVLQSADQVRVRSVGTVAADAEIVSEALDSEEVVLEDTAAEDPVEGDSVEGDSGEDDPETAASDPDGSTI